MKVDITYTPRFHLHMPVTTIALLMKLSGAHYDGRCVLASKSGGFLLGWKRMAELLDEGVPVVFAGSPEIDTLMKICEMGRVMLNKEDMLVVDDFRKSAAEAMVKAGVWQSSALASIGVHDV